MLQPSAPVSSGRMDVSGRHLAFSHFDMACGLTPSRSASFSPVYPSSLRRDAIRFTIHTVLKMKQKNQPEVDFLGRGV